MSTTPQMIPVTEAMRRFADAGPARPALTVGEQTLSRDELERRTNRLARAFERHGVRQGDFVTIALPNSMEFIECALAALKLGATPQPVSSRLPQAELDAIVELARPSLVVGASMGAGVGAAHGREVVVGAAHGREVVVGAAHGRAVVVGAAHGREVVVGAAHGRDAGLRAGIPTGDPRPTAAPTCLPAGFVPDPALSDAPLPTRVAKNWKAPTSGGSTGRPKLIVSGSPAEVDWSVKAYAMPLLLPREGAMLIPGPLYHNAPFTCALQALFRGNHVIVMPRFDALQALALVEQHKANAVLLVPTMMSRIWKLSEAERTRFDLSSLRVAFHMASHCPEWLKAAWIDWLGADRVFELYGGTEMQALTVIRGDEWLAHRGSVGRVVFGQMKIVDEHGRDLPVGQTGEICMRTPPGAPPSYFYIGAEARRIGDWESLGDIGRFDEDGYLYLADRRTDLILRGGANIYPAEIEAALDEHPAVHSSAVIGLPDEDLGQRVHAIVHARGAVSFEDLTRHVAARLVSYKVPASFEFVDAPVRGDDGKVRRSALREERTGAVKR